MPSWVPEEIYEELYIASYPPLTSPEEQTSYLAQQIFQEILTQKVSHNSKDKEARNELLRDTSPDSQLDLVKEDLNTISQEPSLPELGQYMTTNLDTSTMLEPLTGASSESREGIAHGPQISDHISHISPQPTLQVPSQVPTIQTKSSETDMIGKEPHETPTTMIMKPRKPISGNISTHTLSPRPSSNFLIGEATKVHISPANSGSQIPDCCIDSSDGPNHEVQKFSHMKSGNNKSGRNSNFGVFRSFRIATPSPKARINSNLTKPIMIGQPSVSGVSLETSSFTAADNLSTNIPTHLVNQSPTGDTVVAISPIVDPDVPESSPSPATDTTITVIQLPNTDISSGETVPSANDTVITIGSSSNSEAVRSSLSPATDTTITVSQLPNTDISSGETVPSANDTVITIGSSSNSEALRSSLSPDTDTTITVSQFPNIDTNTAKGESSMSANNTVIMIGSSSNFEALKSSSYPATDTEITKGQFPNIDKAMEGSSSTPTTKYTTNWHLDVDESMKNPTEKSSPDTLLEQAQEKIKSPTNLLVAVGEKDLNYVPLKIVPTNTIVGIGKKNIRKGYRMTRRALMRKQILTLLVGRELAGPAKELIKRSIDTNDII